MSQFLGYTVLGLSLAGIYAVAASGLVVTYTTSGIFNFAHGAIGMMGAFAYWQLSSEDAMGLPAPVAFVLVVFVAGPLFGALVERVIMRGLEGTSEVTRLVVTFGLLASLIALAQILWPSDVNRAVPPFFEGAVQFGDVSVSYHRIVVVGVAIAVAAVLRTVLFGTRAGVAMRAVVDDRALAQLNGARPNRSSMLAWALGCSLATLAGVLVAEKSGLDVYRLTFLVVNAYAAAVFGRLVNLPRTFVGAIILGLTEAYATGYLPDNPTWLPEDVDIVRPLSLAVPIVLLFLVLVVMPGAPLRGTTVRMTRERARVPTWRSWAIGAVVLVPVVAVVSGALDPADTIGWGRGLAYAMIMLSFVPLTGYGGQISLAQMTFAGIGAYAAAQWGAGGSPLGLAMAVLLAAAVGALVALPALRLRGIYLALATLAFAFFVDRVVFTQQALFESASRPVDRVQLGPLDLSGDRAYLVFLAVTFAALAALVVWIRRGPFGRRLVAMKDSPAACATLGMNVTRTKLAVFALSAGIAGLGGALLAGLEGNARPSQYEALQGLPLLLMAVAGGIALVSGVFAGGVLLASFPIVSEAIPGLANPLLLAPGLLGISLGRNPNGMVDEVSSRIRAIRAAHRGDPAVPTGLAGFEPVRDLENMGIDRPFEPADVAILDGVLHIDDVAIEAVGMGVRR